MNNNVKEKFKEVTGELGEGYDGRNNVVGAEAEGTNGKVLGQRDD